MTLAPPTLLDLPSQDLVADLPVEQHQLLIDRQRGALLSGMDATFEVAISFGR
ncbi:hypothetical protein PF66_01889 [Pseudomonas asplenii]|uniref:Uncharacterized protein n=1 Tax=Pseudomonas asplenii TaxID=53407 RepID=A0A0M9GIA7_9PSED|nr:hypothetical protein PF66_01889 [Pseudomonas fuscovaginae]